MELEYEIQTKSDVPLTGQTTNITSTTSTLTCPDLPLTIELGYYRSGYKNEELLKKILLFITEEIYK